MAKWVNDDMLDLSLQWIIDNCDEMILCTQQPTTYIEATATYDVADVAMVPADFTGPVAGVFSGRRITVAEKDWVPVDTVGEGDHVALVGTINSVDTLMYVTTCDTIDVDPGYVKIPTWDIEIEDPA